jgi:hypothetical protein
VGTRSRAPPEPARSRSPSRPPRAAPPFIVRQDRVAGCAGSGEEDWRARGAGPDAAATRTAGQGTPTWRDPSPSKRGYDANSRYLRKKPHSVGQGPGTRPCCRRGAGRMRARRLSRCERKTCVWRYCGSGDKLAPHLATADSLGKAEAYRRLLVEREGDCCADWQALSCG